MTCAEEHIARLNAEGQAADSNRRLQVAQEQVAEFAQQREEEASTLLQEVSRALSSLETSNDPTVLAVLQVSACLLSLPRVLNFNLSNVNKPFNKLSGRLFLFTSGQGSIVTLSLDIFHLFVISGSAAKVD